MYLLESLYHPSLASSREPSSPCLVSAIQSRISLATVYTILRCTRALPIFRARVLRGKEDGTKLIHPDAKWAGLSNGGGNGSGCLFEAAVWVVVWLDPVDAGDG